jgi:hypothetical protein
MTIGRKEITRRVGYHPANDTTAPQHDTVRNDVIKLMNKWDKLLADGREKSLAFTDLQSAGQWANTAIAGGADGSEVPTNGAVVDRGATAANARVGAK